MPMFGALAECECETWTIEEAVRRRLEAIEMWCSRSRCMLEIKWSDKITSKFSIEFEVF